MEYITPLYISENAAQKSGGGYMITLLFLYIIMLIIFEYNPAADHPGAAAFKSEAITTAPARGYMAPFTNILTRYAPHLRPFMLRPCRYTPTRLKRVKTALKRLTTAYTAPVYIQVKPENDAPPGSGTTPTPLYIAVRRL